MGLYKCLICIIDFTCVDATLFNVGAISNFRGLYEEKNRFSTIIYSILVFARFGFVKFMENQTAKGRAASMIPTVSLGTVAEEDVANSIETQGRIVAKYDVDIVAKVSGSLLQKHFNEGDYVQKGQLYLQLTRRNMQ